MGNMVATLKIGVWPSLARTVGGYHYPPRLADKFFRDKSKTSILKMSFFLQ